MRHRTGILAQKDINQGTMSLCIIMAVAVVCPVVHHTPSLPGLCSSVPAGGGCRALLQRGRDRRQQDLAATSRHTKLPHNCRSNSRSIGFFSFISLVFQFSFVSIFFQFHIVISLLWLRCVARLSLDTEC